MFVVVFDAFQSNVSAAHTRNSAEEMTFHSEVRGGPSRVAFVPPQKTHEITLVRLHFELQEHFRDVALKSDLLLPKSKQDAQKRVDQIGSCEKAVVGGFSIEFRRAVKHNTYLLLDTMVDAMVGDVPAWFVDVIHRYTLAEVILDHLIHKRDVLLFVVIVSFHFPLQIIESLFGHGEVAFKCDDRFLGWHWYFVVAVGQVLAIGSGSQELFVFTKEGRLLLNIVEIFLDFPLVLLVWIRFSINPDLFLVLPSSFSLS